MNKGRILIVDDEYSVRDSLARWLREDGYVTETADGATEALERLNNGRWDLALVDIKMPGVDGIELQARLKGLDPDLTIIIMTGYASVETAVTALKQGAYDYVTKPLDPDDISHTIGNALAHRRADEEVSRMKEVIASDDRFPNLIGRSPAMSRVFDAIETVASTEATVLVTGESGTGKELVARAIHNASPRRYQPIVTIHCGALTETLLESELFGHEKGAFTGAQYRRKGKFELGNGGTVFLDEIGDISLKTQTDLLRVLQEHEITRVGGHQAISIDFRCVAATNKDLGRLIDEGLFRPDLFYRLNVFSIVIPPLRERRDDIPLLVEHFLDRFSLVMNKRVQSVAPRAMTLLQEHTWPGNVRELENAVERAMVVARGRQLDVEDFALAASTSLPDTGRSLRDIEREHILRVVEDCDQNQTKAAKILGIDRVTLHKKLKDYGWSREEAVHR